MIAQLSQTWWLIAISISAGVAGQTSIKLGVSEPGSSAGGIAALITLILTTPLVLLGLLLYGIGALAWIAVLTRMDLGYAYPFLALNFLLITVVSYTVLGETVPLARWLGILVICAGIVIVARTGV